MSAPAPESSSHRFVVAAAFTVAVAMIAQQLAGKAIRDAYFLSVFDAEVLPRVMTISSILSVVAVLGVTRLYARYAPRRLVPLFFLISASLYVFEWVLSRDFPRLAATSLYLHATSFGAVAISGFWGVMNERFDPHTAKRVIGRVAGGATLGGVLGGLAAWQGSKAVALPTMLLALAVVNVFCGLLLTRVGAGSEDVELKRAASAEPPWAAFEETPYLRHLALLVALTAAGTAGIDYVFKATAAATYQDKSELVSFFALFYLGVGVVTFVLQNAVGNRFVQKAGLAASIATLPFTIFFFGGVALFVPGLAAMAALRGGAATVESSTFRSGYELLYTPMPPHKKRPTKTLIDVGGDKLGAAAGGAIAVFLVGLIPGLATPVLVGIALLCAGTGLYLSRRLGTGYVTALEESLASGVVDYSEVPLEDATTREIVERTVAALDRSVLTRAPTAASAPEAKEAAGILEPPELPSDDGAGNLRAFASFAARDVRGIEWALRRAVPLPAEWVPSLIPLLADSRCADLVHAKLLEAAPPRVGALVDALLSRATPIEARRRIAEILGRTATQRTALGLLTAIDTEPFEIRFRAACALSDAKEKNPDLLVEREAIYRAALREIDAARLNFFGSGEDETGSVSAAGTDAGRTVAYCVRLLAVILPSGPLYLALDALGADEGERRGTGLEYLENVLPTELEKRLFPFFLNKTVARYARQSDAAILREIAREERDGISALEKLKARVRRIYGSDSFPAAPPP